MHCKRNLKYFGRIAIWIGKISFAKNIRVDKFDKVTSILNTFECNGKRKPLFDLLKH